MLDITAVQSSTYAAVATYLSAIFTIIAFSTPYWLASDGKQAVKHFNNLGLWEACFTSFQDPNYLYDRVFSGCKWLFDEDYEFMRHILEPPFFVATQVLFTIGFVFLLLAVVAVLAIHLCFVVDNEVIAMKVLSAITFLAALFTTIAVIVFGIKGDDREWMPDPEHNFLSWSFALAVIGSFLQWVASVLFGVESRVLHKKRLKQSNNSFSMEQAEYKA
ncbi:claudin domain containing protein-like protein [Dinothrombium tinctorium]|uniref:Claudin domain containing protein-like protein n=1 Tax=Dinothrombium tinctorium TaxID=1965070 RepID=A0A3S3P040_9ACAR|nr:claudin domain containing protein-like protein [Dinothrombium tinctorium]RWS12557.1 claudin domain containing protein-like protein [Dinothrombium tinctorium]RWS13343.1 claudin domain containing protein-like protein [Dinothrombium tinctorium]RWS13350.1 claudin domain containing protein-like protein [Dinothrombium tinctorium]